VRALPTCHGSASHAKEVLGPPRKTTRRRVNGSTRRRGWLRTLHWQSQWHPSELPAYANSSLITRPLLAIFIGRPLVLVNVVESEMPRALQMLAMTSSLV